MSYEVRHCPFLNRDDSRCAERFQVGHLRDAFHYCFESYKACPTYLELLVERRLRQGQAGVVHVERPETYVAITVSGKNAA